MRAFSRTTATCLICLSSASVQAEPEKQAPVVTLGPTQGLTFTAPDHAAELSFHMAAWGRIETTAQRGHQTHPTFSVPLIRPYVETSLFGGKLHTFVQPELAGSNARLLDAFIEARFSSALQLRAGLFRTPFTRAYISPAIQLQWPDRGTVVSAFHLGRDTGLMLFGQAGETRSFEYYLGVFNGAPLRAPAQDTPVPMPVARVVFNAGDPVPYDQSPAASGQDLQGLALGLGSAFYRSRSAPSLPTVRQDNWTAGTDLSWVRGLLTGQGEFFIRYVRPRGTEWIRSTGAYVQSGVFVLREHLEVVARLGWLERAPDDNRQTYEVGLNAYTATDNAPLGHHLKISVRYGYDEANYPLEPSFVSYSRHQVTLQGQWWM